MSPFDPFDDARPIRNARPREHGPGQRRVERSQLSSAKSLLYLAISIGRSGVPLKLATPSSSQQQEHAPFLKEALEEVRRSSHPHIHRERKRTCCSLKSLEISALMITSSLREGILAFSVCPLFGESLITAQLVALLESGVAKIIVATIEVMAGAYYVHWLFPIVKRHGRSVWNWLVTVLNPASHKESGDQSRDALHTRLRQALLWTSAQVMLLLRGTVLGAFFWRWWRCHGATQPWEPDLLKSWEPFRSAFLLALAVSYLIFLHLARRKAEQAQAQINDMAAQTPTEDRRTWPSNWPDVFFVPAILDIVFVSLAGLAVPGVYTEVHLGFFTAVAASWLFNAAGRTLLLWLCIVSFLFVQFGWTWWVATHVPSAQGVIVNWSHMFFGSTIPRVLFWLVICLLMVTMRALRREVEEQASFFRTLSEGLPFEVFVKDSSFGFVYANQRLIEKLRENPGQSQLTSISIVGKKDNELGVEQQKVDAYRRIDEQLINGALSESDLSEPSYRYQSPIKIRTRKVVIRGRKKSATYILGLCSDEETKSDEWFFLNMVVKLKRYCFFLKERGRFQWVNEQFERDAGRVKADIINFDDLHLYEERDARIYIKDDELLRQHPILHREEWHQPKGQSRRRVRTIKELKGQEGVRGCFYDIQKEFILRAGTDQILSDLWRALAVQLEKSPQGERYQRFKQSIELITRCLRLLNLSEYELNQLCNRSPGGLPKSYSQLLEKQEQANPFTAMLETIEVFKSFTKIQIELHRPDPRDVTIWIDRNLFKVALLGLCFYSRYCIESCKAHPQMEIRLGLAFVEPATDAETIEFFEVKNFVEESVHGIGVDELSELMRKDDQTEAIWLQLSLRAAQLCKGRVTRSVNSGCPGCTLRFEYPKKVSGGVATLSR